MTRLSATQAGEIADLARRFGEPLRVRAGIDDSFDDPIRKDDRVGEVCMVVRRHGGRLLVAIKSFYPRSAYRLPTGGIQHDEPIFDALLREAHEETGLDVEVRQFLAHITYTTPAGDELFHTFAFLLDERGGTLGAIDEAEEIEAWREIDPGELLELARILDDLRSEGTRSIGGAWRAWGRFRAVVHRVVHEALTSAGR